MNDNRNRELVQELARAGVHYTEIMARTGLSQPTVSRYTTERSRLRWCACGGKIETEPFRYAHQPLHRCGECAMYRWQEHRRLWPGKPYLGRARES